MSVAAKLARERAGHIFFQKQHAPLREGDLEFATSLFQGIPFFFIDNASDNSGAISALFQRLRSDRTPACFVLGERLNEWRQDSRGLTGEEHLLEPLSDSEIHRLLKFLEDNNALGELRELDQTLRFAAIKEKHNKELLVAMREATEGRAFDAILENEYRGLANDISRRLYLTVSCIHQHGAFARDTLLADLLGMPLADLYSATSSATEGVVIFDPVDETYGHYLARTRHRTIAAIIWERSSASEEREQLLLKILSALNFSYFSDRETFQHFIRSDRMVDTIRSLDGKIKFFESACKKDPENQYVRQHYARMLLREEKPDLALGQIELALKIDSTAKVLHHTKALALRDLALDRTTSPDIALRRLAQSESEFRRCITIHNRDGYSYQGLAELYLGWAKRALSDDEAASYVAKAEEVINEGLRVVRLRDGLWLVSSEVQKWLGDQPSHFKALERAVADNPEGIVANHLLRRAYRKAGRLGEAKVILHKLISKHPTEFRACVEYARTLHELGEPYSTGIAVLRLSMPHGLSDPRYIACLGGMLFMNGDFSDSKGIFSESVKREFPAVESQKIQFRPRDKNNLSKPLRLPGEVIAVKAGYSFIMSSGYDTFLCPAARYSGVRMKARLEITFEPVFSARGAIAISPQILVKSYDS
jgi:protein involved in temperature-dependent protein secretion